MSTDEDLRSDGRGARASTIVVCSTTLSATLQLDDKPDLIFQSEPGRQYALSGDGLRQIMRLHGATAVVIQRLALVDGHSSGVGTADQGGGAISAVGAAVSLTVVESHFRSSDATVGGAVGCHGATCSFRSVSFSESEAFTGGAAFADATCDFRSLSTSAKQSTWRSWGAVGCNEGSTCRFQNVNTETSASGRGVP